MCSKSTEATSDQLGQPEGLAESLSRTFSRPSGQRCFGMLADLLGLIKFCKAVN